MNELAGRYICDEIDQNMRFRIWRSAVASSNAHSRKEKLQLPSLACTTAFAQQYTLETTSCMTFGAHKFVHSETFLDYLYEV